MKDLYNCGISYRLHMISEKKVNKNTYTEKNSSSSFTQLPIKVGTYGHVISYFISL